MIEKTIKVMVEVCPFCGYEWIPRVAQPKYCTKCKRYLPEVKAISANASVKKGE